MLGARTLNFGEAAAETRCLAGWMRSRGIKQGDRVAIITRNRAEAILAAFATSHVGAIFTIVHSSIKPYGLRPILEQIEPVLVILDETTAHLAAHIGPAPVLWAGVASPGATSWLEATRPEFAEAALIPCRSSDPACLFFTSGSTGFPRGVLINHDSIRFAAAAIQERLRYRSDDLIGVFIPLSFDYGLYQFFLAAQVGAGAFVGSPENLGLELVSRLASLPITVLPGVPILFGTLLKLLRRQLRPLPHLRCVTNTAEHLSKEYIAAIRECIPGVEIYVMYGLTECKRVSILLPHELRSKPDSVGRPLPGTEVFAVDDGGRPMAPGVIGELVVRGAHVGLGYWRAQSETGTRFGASHGPVRELYTGDFGSVDKDGFVYLLGRKDHMLKHHGIRLSPLELERAACSIPGVDAAAAVKTEPMNPLHLFVTGHGGVTANRVLAQLRQLLEPHKVPDEVHVVTELPRNSNGKIDRRAIYEQCHPRH